MGELDGWVLAGLAAAAYLAAGAVKGLTGLGLPTAAIGLTSLFLGPRSAIALVILPMVLTNLWQLHRAGDIRGALWRYRLFGAVLAAMVFAAAMLSAEASERLLLAILGGVITGFCLINLTLALPPLPARYDRIAQALAGAAAGVFGGLTGVWAAPIALYLTARQTPPEEFVRASGLLIFIGSLPLAVSYGLNGFLTGELALASLGLLAPTFLGFALGEALRRRLSPALFRRVFLYVFLILGLNLLRRAVF